MSQKTSLETPFFPKDSLFGDSKRTERGRKQSFWRSKSSIAASQNTFLGQNEGDFGVWRPVWGSF